MKHYITPELEHQIKRMITISLALAFGIEPSDLTKPSTSSKGIAEDARRFFCPPDQSMHGSEDIL